VLRTVVIAFALAAAAVGPARAQIVEKALLMPGVGYERQVEFTSHGPVVLNVVTAPKPDGGLYALRPALSNDAVVATEKLTDIEKRMAGDATTVGIDADFFRANPGRPSGMLMRAGALDSAPAVGRSSLGIAPDGTLQIARVAFSGTWQGTGQRRPLLLNAPPKAGTTTLYTTAWGPETPAEAGVAAALISPFPPSAPNRVLTGVVTQVAGAGPVAIPAGAAVLVSRGGQAAHLTAEAPTGATVSVRLTLTPDWSGMTGAVGGGPLLVRDGKPVFRADEVFAGSLLNPRTTRGAVGQLRDGRIVLAVVDGGRSGYSVGMTNFELAQALVRLGAVQAMALGSGAPASLSFDGALLSRPASGVESEISDALLLAYTGVYAPPPAAPVLSPNGDGVDEAQTLSYRLVRPATVTATLTGPDRITRTLESGAEPPGTHTLAWAGKDDAGAPLPEGSWRFAVTAVDDQGRTSTAERVFSLNDTLGALAVGPGGRATFTLARAARVTATVATRTGVVVSTLLSDELEAGQHTVAWNGRGAGGGRVSPGAYVVHVTAENDVGTAELEQSINAPPG
jgi:flagellar hook assembly protein FlgD